MLDFLKRLFGISSPKETVVDAPYKVEPPKVVEVAPIVVTAKPEPKVEVKAEAQLETKPVKAKKPAAKKAKTATPKTTAKKEPKLKRTK